MSWTVEIGRDLGGPVAMVRCSRCGMSEAVVAAAALEAVAVADPAAPRCPKCHGRYGDRAACPGCGLAVARMAGFALARAEDVPDPVRAAWQAVLANWDQQSLHDAFVQRVAGAGVFAWGAGQYQDMQRQRPDNPIAQRQLDRVRRTAEAAMLASAAVRDVDKRPYRGATAVLIMMIVVLIAGALYAALMRDSSTGGAAATNPAAGPRKLH